MNDYLDHLNVSQRKAVEHISGPLMVIAGEVQVRHVYLHIVLYI